MVTNETNIDLCDKQEDLVPDSELLEIRVSDPSQDEYSQFCADQVSIAPFIQEKPSDISVGPSEPRVRPQNLEFPSRNFSGKLRAFNIAWYIDYPWIEYSVSRNVIFCYACQLFASLYGKSEKVFTLNGFRSWKKGALFVHNTSTMHRNSMLSMEDFKVNSSHSTSGFHPAKNSRAPRLSFSSSKRA